MTESIDALDEQFAELHRQSINLIKQLSASQLYQKDTGEDACGEQVLRSAAVIEQAFGGITANLWDDPFEWTLPEALAAPAKLIEYLQEVEDTRRHAFAALRRDRDLSKEIMTPAGPIQLSPFLLDTFARARHHQQRAVSAFARLKTKLKEPDGDD